MIIAKSLTILIAILSWIAVSNHCALDAVVAQPTIAAQPQCPMHSQPAQQKDTADVQCCKILRATAATPAKSFAKAFFFVAHANFAPAPVVAPLQILRATLEFDTGPPGARTFAESVLQRSILAHAPPVRV
jgi:hypothetical protein